MRLALLIFRIFDTLILLLDLNEERFIAAATDNLSFRRTILFVLGRVSSTASNGRVVASGQRLMTLRAKNLALILALLSHATLSSLLPVVETLRDHITLLLELLQPRKSSLLNGHLLLLSELVELGTALLPQLLVTLYLTTMQFGRKLLCFACLQISEPLLLDIALMNGLQR